MMLEKIRILIVDDDQADRIAVKRAISTTGYDVDILECCDANNVMETCQQHRPHLIFLDINMPGMSGLELLQQISTRYPHILCVMMTGHGNESLAIQCIRSGALDYLLKTEINTEKIKNIIKNACRVHSAGDLFNGNDRISTSHQMVFLNILHSLPALVFTIDEQHVFRLLDGEVQRVIPCGAELLNDNSIYELQEVFPDIVSAYRTALDSGQSQATVEFNGRSLQFRFFRSATRSVCGIILDLTLEKNRQEELLRQMQESQELQKLKEAFLANMSHEIRTPIHGILNLAGILLTTPLNDDQRRFIEAIKASADQLHVLINDILDLSKIQAEKMTFEKAPFSIRSEVTTLTELFTPSASAKGIALYTEVKQEVPELVNGDSVRFTQVLNNLIGNAIKFTSQGYVSVVIQCADRNEKYVVIEGRVTDTGIGIPADKINKIFDSFSQAGSDITRKYGGTGLGLSISKQLIELQGGYIRVESTPGKGSTFTFGIPYEIAQPLQEEQSILQKTALEEPEFQPLHLLVVEDNDVNRIVITKYLKDWNFTYDCASDGLTAIELMERNRYDVILLDVEMPGMKGYDVVKYIRKNLKLETLPVIAMTAHANKEEEQKCLQAGMNDYISKPFHPDDLKLIIYSAIGKQKQSASAASSSSIITDLNYLHEMADGNSEFMRDFISMFLQHAPASLQEIQEGIRQNDWEKLRQAAHKLKPSLSYVGMKEIHSLTARIEDYAKTRTHLDQIPALADKIIQACQQAFIELEKFLQSLSVK
jgi:signal transduction histidine kinase/response regulator RpfG family c-di-GMP phosphodiesterase